MKDITYCAYTNCPLTKCERHLNKRKLNDMQKNGVKEISIADFCGSCREYISYLVEKTCTKYPK